MLCSYNLVFKITEEPKIGKRKHYILSFIPAKLFILFNVKMKLE